MAVNQVLYLYFDRSSFSHYPREFANALEQFLEELQIRLLRKSGDYYLLDSGKRWTLKRSGALLSRGATEPAKLLRSLTVGGSVLIRETAFIPSTDWIREVADPAVCHLANRPVCWNISLAALPDSLSSLSRLPLRELFRSVDLPRVRAQGAWVGRPAGLISLAEWADREGLFTEEILRFLKNPERPLRWKN